jgi:hypothetical protein
MGLFTTTDDKDLEEARKRVVASDLVCPACKAPFTTSGESLAAINPALSLEAHKCPNCAELVTRRVASPDGL